MITLPIGKTIALYNLLTKAIIVIIEGVLVIASVF